MMLQSTATTVFEALASGLRLDIYRLLVREGADGLVAGEISTRLDVPPSNLSFHLKVLTSAGLLIVEQEGRYQRYRANTSLMVNLISYLVDECCGGQPELCLDPGRTAKAAGLRPAPTSKSTKD
jgi:DNA-binding transcriptional ArsR family regulator